MTITYFYPLPVVVWLCWWVVRSFYEHSGVNYRIPLMRDTSDE
jgi:hypothetical protein